MLIKSEQDRSIGIIDRPFNFGRHGALMRTKTRSFAAVGSDRAVCPCIASESGDKILINCTRRYPLERQIRDNHSRIHYLTKLNLPTSRPMRAHNQLA
jgi:hypothetical protein